MSAYLEIYVEAECFVCERSSAIADEVRAAFADVDVRVIDLAGAEGRHRDLVVAAPTYVLNGRVVSLGNPDRAALHDEIAHVQGATP